MDCIAKALVRRVETRIGRVLELSSQAQQRRAVGKTNMNEHSSRYSAFKTGKHFAWIGCFRKKGVYSIHISYRFKDESSTRASCIALGYGAFQPFETILPSCMGIILSHHQDPLGPIIQSVFNTVSTHLFGKHLVRFTLCCDVADWCM